MSRNNSTAGSLIGSLIGLIIFVGFGAFFLLRLSPFAFLRIMPFFPMIFIIIIIGFVGAASARSRRSTCCSQKPHNQNQSLNQYQYSTQEVPRTNPYIVKAPSSSTVRPIFIDDVEPEKPKTNFCQYCGTKKERNAVYCHSCGTKLE